MTRKRLRKNLHIHIEAVGPAVDSGRYPVKRVAGETLSVGATVFRDGHDSIRVALQYRKRGERRYTESPMRVANSGLDRWQGALPLTENTSYFYRVEAWTDRFGTWRADLEKRVRGGQEDVESEVLEGLRLIESAQARARGNDRQELMKVLSSLREARGVPQAALEVVSGDGLHDLMNRLQPRTDAVRSEPDIEVVADRPRAQFGSWYEMFVRSLGTFRDAERRLEDLERMGFDVLYLAPIHPVGKTSRKGKDNALVAGPEDPGSPWAIGSESGGHTAIDPALGTIEDFDRFVAAARRRGIEIALDLAIQCSPDHPWVREHPEWFYRRPDGTIKFAENPPKKYEDIYPLDFDTPDWPALWEAWKEVFLFWIEHGVRIFRVDNPHTKPLPFWEWLIGEMRADHPDAIFLAEAFTRPPMMYALARLGFTQSYTYFPWRNTKSELTEYLTELTSPPVRDYFRPNFFINTPDILPRILVDGGRPAFLQRLVLAATLSPTYGIYGGYEICERDWMPHHAIPGDIEYRDSEKYEIKTRDWDAPENIHEEIARINRIRKENPAFHSLDNLSFLSTDNDQILAFVKATPDRSNVFVVAVNLDPHHTQECIVRVGAGPIGTAPGEAYVVQDLLNNERYTWKEANYVRLDPKEKVAHIFRVDRT